MSFGFPHRFRKIWHVAWKGQCKRLNFATYWSVVLNPVIPRFETELGASGLAGPELKRGFAVACGLSCDASRTLRDLRGESMECCALLLAIDARGSPVVRPVTRSLMSKPG